MKQIEKKFKDLVKEIKWRYKTTDYKEEDKKDVVIHETIDKDVSFISIADVENLSNELGISKILGLEKSYIDEFGTMGDKEGIDKLRLILYWYFETRVNDEAIL